MDRRLTTIVAADVAGFSRLVEQDEEGTLRSQAEIRAELIDPLLAVHEGRIANTAGDSLLIEFSSTVNAVRFSLAFQESVATRNSLVKARDRIEYRIGINLGDVVVRDGDLLGDGVNIAARLEAISQPGGITVSAQVYELARDKISTEFSDLGEVKVKNIARPVRVFQHGSVLSNSEMSNAVRRKKLAQAAVVCATLAAIFLWFAKNSDSFWAEKHTSVPIATSGKPSIAILPFDNLSDDATQEYFSEGMSEDLITDLSKVEGLFVIARNSSFSYKNREATYETIAQELGVQFLLQGSVRRAGGRVRINAQLVEAANGVNIWADRYDGTINDIFDLQDRVTASIVAALSLNLTTNDQARLADHGTTSTMAHDAFLKGWALLRSETAENAKKALPFLNSALQFDHDYNRVHASLALLYQTALLRNWSFELGIIQFDLDRKLQIHLEAALRNPTPLAHVVNARMMASAGLLELAAAEVEKAVALDRNDPVALSGFAQALILVDRPVDAEIQIRAAMRADPLHPPSYWTVLGSALFQQGKFEEAIPIFREAIEQNPDDETNYLYLAACYSVLGRIDDGEKIASMANDVSNRNKQQEFSLEGGFDSSITPYRNPIDFSAFGSLANQSKVKDALRRIPILSWQYLISVRDAGSDGVFWDVDGAERVSIERAGELIVNGALLLDTSPAVTWERMHVKGSVNLPYYRDHQPDSTKLTRQSISLTAEKEDAIIVTCSAISCADNAAKLVNWGYKNVYFVRYGFAENWLNAGFEVVVGENR